MVKRSGFTIVELLIVIVIISILAAVTIVTYNGLQIRAENTKTISAVSSYKNAIMAYAAQNGNYPPPNGYSCLGAPNTVCGNVTGTNASCFYVYRINTTTQFSSAIATVLTSTPQPSVKSANCNGDGYGGAFYDGSNLRIIWYLLGDQQCDTVTGLQNYFKQGNSSVTQCLGSLPAVS